MSNTQEIIAKAAAKREAARLELITEAIYDAVFTKHEKDFGWTYEHIHRLFCGITTFEVNAKYRPRFKGVRPTRSEILDVLEELAALGFLEKMSSGYSRWGSEYKFVPCSKRRSTPKTEPSSSKKRRQC